MSLDFDHKVGKVTVRDTDSFPREIFDIADQIKVLDMSTVSLASLPEDLGRLVNLQTLFFSNNKALKEVPEVLASCQKLETIGLRSCSISKFSERCLPPSLRALILTDNQITELPRSIGDCTNLQKIMLAGNRLQSLPQELLRCQNLEIVRFSVNHLLQSPDWLFELPRLAWYGDSSNPFSMQQGRTQINEVDWNDITFGKELGRSVNNIVYYGQLKDGREVAVKIYGHDLVTDGLPADDMNACLRIGDHQNVIGGIGKVVHAPDNQPALVMPLISSDYKNLGKPPSLSTVCRDTYPEGQTFTASYVYQVIKTAAIGMRHLHSMGVMHGDLYAHNILTNAAGESCVGDFGAASLYKPGSTVGALRERIDMRAFGVLIEELVSRIAPTTDKETTIAKLQNLGADCMNENTKQRPSFAEIDAFLTR
jgi:serine/threonine protein kinase